MFDVPVIPVDVVVEWVVAGECKEHSKTGTERKEHLMSGIDPYLQPEFGKAKPI